MSNYTKHNPPPNPHLSLIARSIHEPGSIEWIESNICNWLISAIHECGYWSKIDYIFPEPCQENQWLYNVDTKSFIGYFIAQYEGLYGYWSNNYAYRSHFFKISTELNTQSYYTGGDPPQFLIDTFADKGSEIVIWEKTLNKDHPLLQKAKAECANLNPPLNKSVATRIWNKSTPVTFWTDWSARKAKHLSKAEGATNTGTSC